MNRSKENHFNDLDYDNELPEHITQYFVERKCGKIKWYALAFCKCTVFDPTEHRIRPFVPRGIDLGCGTGHHIRYLANPYLPQHLDVCGVDNAHGSYGGDIRDLYWIGDETYDFAYTINVLHHMGDKHDQIGAVQEAHRILKKGGLFIIMEMNFKNPLIAFYVKYLFKKFRVIDQGAENWFDSNLLQQVEGFKLVKTEYFTFTPDFCPRWLLPLFRRIDEWADNKWFSKYGAHVMYVMEKE